MSRPVGHTLSHARSLSEQEREAREGLRPYRRRLSVLKRRGRRGHTRSMTNATCSNRPKRYHRRGGLWEKPLEVLVRHGRPDHEIAWILSRLDRDALMRIHSMADPDDHAVEALAGTWDADLDRWGRWQATRSAPPAWTRRQVQHHRHRLGLASRVRRERSLALWWSRGLVPEDARR